MNHLMNEVLQLPGTDCAFNLFVSVGLSNEHCVFSYVLIF